MKDEITVSARKAKQRKRRIKIVKLLLLVLILFLIVLYLVMGLVYNNGNFSITLDKNLYYDKGLIIYDNPDYKVYRSELFAESIESFDNFSYKWLPKDIYKHGGGSHNGDNYVAYTFFVENKGEHVTDYWSEIIIDDVVKKVDDAVRVRVYKEDEYVTYAKMSARGRAEKDTVPFVDKTLIARDHVEKFKPGDILKYTMVFWLEGTDPECTDNILGGEIKMHMSFNSEIVD